MLDIGATVADAERVRDSVAPWFHTFALAPGIFTPAATMATALRCSV